MPYWSRNTGARRSETPPETSEPPSGDKPPGARCAIFEVNRKVRVLRKLILVIAGAVASGSAAAALGMGASTADPGSGNLLNVVGEPYAKAVAILHAQGVPTSFGGSVGSDVPQAQCIVSSQKVLSTRKMQLMLDCTAAAQPQAPQSPTGSSGTSGTSSTQATDGGRPTPGAPGVVTVIPTRVG